MKIERWTCDSCEKPIEGAPIHLTLEREVTRPKTAEDNERRLHRRRNPPNLPPGSISVFQSVQVELCQDCMKTKLESQIKIVWEED